MMDEKARWDRLSPSRKIIFTGLLKDIEEFRGFLIFAGADGGEAIDIASLIRTEY